MRPDWIEADWPAPAVVSAFCTTRAGGVSRGPWSSLNLGTRCGDEASLVGENRARLNELLPAPAHWLRQVHGTSVVTHPGQFDSETEADAVVSFQPLQVCAVLTADCLPVFFCNRSGDRVGLAHAGWRGLAGGILQATVSALDDDPRELMAWMGPAIGPRVYEVGADVVEAFPGEFTAGFTRHGDRFLMDIYAVAKIKLANAGVGAIYGSGFCTMSDPGRFFSYRRDGVTGRMASLVWLDNSNAEASKPV